MTREQPIAGLERDIQALREELVALRDRVDHSPRKHLAKAERPDAPAAAPREYQPMTPEEFQAARTEFGLTKRDFAQVFDVNERTVRSWETGTVKGGPAPIPRPIAMLVRLALRHAPVRKEMGLP